MILGLWEAEWHEMLFCLLANYYHGVGCMSRASAFADVHFTLDLQPDP